MNRVLIVEGVTGAGKSSVLAELRRRLDDTEFVMEEETLGDLMNQVRHTAWRQQPTFEALESVLTRVERESDSFLIERFHLTAYALFPEWKHYQGFDDRLQRLAAAMVLLTFPEHQANERSISRPDRENWEKEVATCRDDSQLIGEKPRA
jgi:thymidylate kinase